MDWNANMDEAPRDEVFLVWDGYNVSTVMRIQGRFVECGAWYVRLDAEFLAEVFEGKRAVSDLDQVPCAEITLPTHWMPLPNPPADQHKMKGAVPEIESPAKLPPEVLEALGFYADPQSYADGPSLSGVAWVPDIAVLSDRGKRAEAALKHYRKGEAA